MAKVIIRFEFGSWNSNLKMYLTWIFATWTVCAGFCIYRLCINCRIDRSRMIWISLNMTIFVQIFILIFLYFVSIESKAHYENSNKQSRKNSGRTKKRSNQRQDDCHLPAILILFFSNFQSFWRVFFQIWFFRSVKNKNVNKHKPISWGVAFINYENLTKNARINGSMIFLKGLLVTLVSANDL